MHASSTQRSTRNESLEAQAEALRPYLFAIAYRMLGSASEAEDIVQESFLRFFSRAPEAVNSPRAYLSTVVTRLALDYLKSARVTREQYRGPWLPEPALTADLDPGPDVQAERKDDVSLAFMVMLEHLTPEERAAFVLREAFDFRYDDIARVLNKTTTACRKLVQRARAKLDEGDRRQPASHEDQLRLTERFLTAARDGDLQALTETLAEDVTIWADGGDQALAARRPVTGRDNISRYSVGLVNKIFPDAVLTIEHINGEIGLLMWSGESLLNATTATVAGGRITELRAVVNPEKLAFLQRRLSPPTAATA